MLLLGIDDVSSHAVHEFFQRMGPLDIEKTPAVAVGINVEGGVGNQFVGMVFAPFRRPEQPGLFAVPGAENDRALRLPSLLEKLAEGARFFQQGNLAGERDPRRR